MPSPTSKTRISTESVAEIFEAEFVRLMPSDHAPQFRASFRPYARLRSTVRYDPKTKCVRINLSDLLRTAPAEVLEALAVTLLGRLYRCPIPRRARRVYRRWVNSPATQERMLEVRRDRGSKTMLPPEGRAHDLESIFASLNRRHFESALRKPALGWTRHPARRRMGHYDPAHDAIAINRALDSPAVPKIALEYVLFHEMLHVKHPVRVRNGRRFVHTPEFLAEERRFPGYREARKILRLL